MNTLNDLCETKVELFYTPEKGETAAGGRPGSPGEGGLGQRPRPEAERRRARVQALQSPLLGADQRRAALSIRDPQPVRGPCSMTRSVIPGPTGLVVVLLPKPSPSGTSPGAVVKVLGPVPENLFLPFPAHLSLRMGTACSVRSGCGSCPLLGVVCE